MYNLPGLTTVAYKGSTWLASPGGGCPPHRGPGVQPVHCSLARELLSRTLLPLASLAFLCICVFNPSPSLQRPLYPSPSHGNLLRAPLGEGVPEDTSFHPDPGVSPFPHLSLPPPGALPLPPFPGHKMAGVFCSGLPWWGDSAPSCLWCYISSSPSAVLQGKFSCCFYSLRKWLKSCLILSFWLVVLIDCSNTWQLSSWQVAEGIKKMFNLEETLVLIAILVLSKFPTFSVTRNVNYACKTFREGLLKYENSF